MKNRTDFRVKPGLSITGKEIQARVENGSLRPKAGQGQYTDDAELTRMKQMSRAELAREHLNATKQISEFKMKLKSMEDLSRAEAEANKRFAAKEAEAARKAEAAKKVETNG